MALELPAPPGMVRLNELALFAGAGGGLLGSKMLGWRTVCAVEIDPYCREVLLRRQEEGHLEPFPIWDDIRTFDGKSWRGKVDVITGGFPCQPWSCAGKQQGESDKRNLWPDTIRVICEVRPHYVYLENVPALLTHEYYGTILGQLAEAGYDVQWCVLGADDVGAPHRRKRIWLVAYSENISRGGTSRAEDARRRLEEIRRSMLGAWPPGPGEVAKIPRMVDGMAYRMDRLKALGNGQVPQCFVAAWKYLLRFQGT